MGSIQYHLKELEIGLDKNDERRILPNLLDSDTAVLDIGCGIGQTFIALGCTDRFCVGLDIDDDAIRYGIEAFGRQIHFILADAKHIPLPSETFNLVYSRVSLPYMNIPRVIEEIRRVLRNDGRVWMTLHGRDVPTRYLEEAIKSRNTPRLIHAVYTLMNGYLLKYFGFVLPFANARYESWQDTSAMKRLLIRNGFDVHVCEVGRRIVIEGRLI